MLVLCSNKKKAQYLQLLTPGHITTTYLHFLPDRNYMQEDSCLPDQSSVLEDLPDTPPLAHDDLGCPIRRDRVYHQDNMGATAKPLSGPPVSPSLFRSPRSSAPERSPKAIQASIKESASLAAAISLQWKEEVSAMRRELAELRRDLCKELRAFNSNFNTFTQHYNTWSPQGGHMATAAAQGLVGGLGVGQGFGTSTAAETRISTGIETGPEKSRAHETDRATLGAREKKPQVSKVSVGTQARSKVLVRQSTADAAVNCPDEKEERKSGRKGLPKQHSMDPSILACPQSMYVESAIPLSLDPILPSTVQTVKPKKTEMTIKPSKSKADHVTQLADVDVGRSPERGVVHESIKSITQTTMPSLSDSPRDPVSDKQEMLIAKKLTTVDIVLESASNTDPCLPDEEASDGTEHKDAIVLLPYPVPMVTVSPPEDDEVMSDSESLDPVTMEKPDLVSYDPATVSIHYSGVDKSPADTAEPEPKTSDSPPPPYPGTQDNDTVKDSYVESIITCPSIVVSQYLDPEPPESPTDSIPDPLPIVNISDVDSPFSTSPSSSTQPACEPEPRESEWPPLPEPLETVPIYQSDLVHFDLVMLTSLDQDDLDSVFMDPEPEPFDFSVDSLSNNEDPPFYQDCLSSPLSTVDPATLCPLDLPQPTELAYLDPSMNYNLDDMPQNVASDFQVPLLPLVTVTISPPSSVSPDSSVDIDFGCPTPDSPSSPDFKDMITQSADLPHLASDDMLAKSQESLAVSQESGSVMEDETASNSERSSEQMFLWNRWQKKTHRHETIRRSASVELWSGRYEYNSAEITYVSLTL